jgi:alkanesulfonate monooxygenase SsuD/methylene tetrahydromethanopterin reductase-like flavin-dependent oxidoreductase (luciferase family)
MACVNLVAADTDEEAEFLATSVKQMFMGVITGRRQLLQPPVKSMEGIWSVYEEAAVMEMLAYSFIGSKKKIQAALSAFVQENGVDELMATSHIYEHGAKLKSFSLFAEALKLS